MASAGDVFLHSYGDALDHLKLIQAETVLEAENDAPSPHVHTELTKQFKSMVGSLIKDLSMEKPEAEVVFKRALAAMNRIERQRFLLENLLEAVKRDESLQNSLGNYGRLGLLDFGFPNTTEEKRQSPWASNHGAGRLLRTLWDRLRQVAITVMEIAINAIKAVPKLVAIKPKPSIGLSGPFPTFSLQFELEAESITIHELFNDLKAGIT
jgi:hypothetical protein